MSIQYPYLLLPPAIVCPESINNLRQFSFIRQNCSLNTKTLLLTCWPIRFLQRSRFARHLWRTKSHIVFLDTNRIANEFIQNTETFNPKMSDHQFKKAQKLDTFPSSNKFITYRLRRCIWTSKDRWSRVTADVNIAPTSARWKLKSMAVRRLVD